MPKLPKFCVGQRLVYRLVSDDGITIQEKFVIYKGSYVTIREAASWVTDLSDGREMAVWDSCLRTASPDNYGDEDDA